MKLYNNDGYVDISAIINCRLPFLFCIGGRGTGKTYGALKYALDNNIKFIFLRRTQSQVDLIAKPEFSPFKAICEDTGEIITVKKVNKYNSAFYRGQIQDEKIVPVGEPIGYIIALSTISNLRGFDASDVTLLIFDEFIPERHERPIKNEAAAFLNAYETINRNRELKGFEPLAALCLANANDLGNDIFRELGLIGKVERMKAKNQSYSLDYARGIGIFLLQDSPISSRKVDTALYRAANNSDYKDMALNNQFEELKHSKIQTQPIKEYIPLVVLGELAFYKHKSKKQYYCTTYKTGSPESYGTSETELKRFVRRWQFLYDLYLKNMIIFEDATAELLFTYYLV